MYDYDAYGNLRGVDLSDGRHITYLVDGLGRRIGRKTDGTLDRGFVYGEGPRPSAETNADGNVRSRFVYATGALAPDYMIRGGRTYRFVTDHTGSPRMIVDTSDGSVAQRLDYDPVGRVTHDSNPGFQPFGYTGGLYDPDTGLVRSGARDYDAETGRWTSKDPIDYGGGDTNLYGYVLGDPINYVDPDGEAAVAAVAIGAVGIGLAVYGSYETFNNFKRFIFGCGSLGSLALDAGLTLVGGGVIKGAIKLGQRGTHEAGKGVKKLACTVGIFCATLGGGTNPHTNVKVPHPPRNPPAAKNQSIEDIKKQKKPGSGPPPPPPPPEK